MNTLRNPRLQIRLKIRLKIIIHLKIHLQTCFKNTLKIRLKNTLKNSVTNTGFGYTKIHITFLSRYLPGHWSSRIWARSTTPRRIPLTNPLTNPSPSIIAVVSSTYDFAVVLFRLRPSYFVCVPSCFACDLFRRAE